MGRDVKMDVQLGVSQGDFAGRLDVIAGPTGRRSRTDIEKARIATESFAPGAVVADVARQHGVTRWQVYDWRRRFRNACVAASQADMAPVFVPLAIDDSAKTDAAADMIEVTIGDVVVRVGSDVNEALLARIFRAVRAAS